jgi:hypothetical protein
MELSGERRIGPSNLYGVTRTLGQRSTRFFVWLGVVVGSIAALAWLVFSGDACNAVLFDVEFAGSSERFTERYRTNAACDLSAMRSVVWINIALSAYATAAIALFLTVWWNASWVTEPGFSRLSGVAFAGVALAAFVADSIKNVAALLGLQSDGEVIGLRFARFIFTVGWIKWMLVAILVAAVVSVTLAWLIRAAAAVYRLARGSDDANHVPPMLKWSPEAQPPELGICLSGGGIRSAAFSLGALSTLEETAVDHPRPGQPPGVLGQADLLASVSGGGYAASCWRTAVGFGKDAILDRTIIGDPNCYSSSGGSAPAIPTVLGARDSSGDLFPQLRDVRDYLRNGRGGLLFSAVVVVAQMIWHLFLTIAVLAILAWPLGRLIRGWLITTPLEVNGDIIGSVEYSRLVVPTVGLLLIVAAVLVARSFTTRGRLRQSLDAAALGLIGLAALLFVALVAVPWMVLELLPAIDSLLPGAAGANSALATFLGGSVVASVLRMVRAPIQSRARYLGGVLLAGCLVWFVLVVASHATRDDAVLSLGWQWWFLAVAGYTTLVMVTNPDLWSLHWLYRLRLAETFARRWNDETGQWEALSTADQPPMSAYRDAPGPKQVICAVAARGDRTNTGIPVVSMTFEPDFVTVHCGPDPSDPNDSHSHAISTADYEELFHGRAFAHRYRTVFSATALSAAAVAPSLGRMNMGSTNALIAALNLRLGVWMPNPMYGRGRRASPDLFNMFRELGGSFDLEDPNVYVTDGGHWENLALVELIRRKTKRIISVDASGDKDFSFASLLEAVELAELECATRITFVGDGLEGMRPGDGPKAPRNWCRADIAYPDGSTGRLLYVKAQASEQMPLDVLRYSKEDPTFPNYSTADQLLKEAEFCNLAILGRESMIGALDEFHRWLFAPAEAADTANAADPGSGYSGGSGTADTDADGQAFGFQTDDGARIDLTEPTRSVGGDVAVSVGYDGEPLEVIATPDRRAELR